MMSLDLKNPGILIFKIAEYCFLILRHTSTFSLYHQILIGDNAKQLEVFFELLTLSADNV